MSSLYPAHSQVQEWVAGRARLQEKEICPSCQIAFSTEAMLGEPNGEGQVSLTHNIVRIGDSYAVTLQDSTRDVRIYSARGGFQRTIRTTTSGGFEWITALAVRRDSLWVLDSGRRQAAVFSKAFDLGRVVPMNITIFPGGAVELPDGDLLVNGEAHHADYVGIDIYRLGAEGNIKNAFGGGDFVMELGQAYERRRGFRHGTRASV